MIWLINTLIRVTEQSNSSLPSKIRHIFFDSNAENNDNDIKFQVGDYATMSTLKIFQRNFFYWQKVKITLAWASVIENRMLNKWWIMVRMVYKLLGTLEKRIAKDKSNRV